MATVKCEVLNSNIWTSKGKFLFGETFEIDEAEAKTYGDAVKVQKPKAAKKAKKADT